MTPIEQRIEMIIADPLLDMGYEIVRLKLFGGHQARRDGGVVLQIMLDRADGFALSVEDCAKASRQISALMDVEDPLADAYTLEVSSPGIDRPLVKLAHFEKYHGEEARIETHFPVEGRRRFRGLLDGTTDEAVLIQVEGTIYQVPVTEIRTAKLVLTDRLLARHAREQKNQVEASDTETSETETSETETLKAE